MKHTYIIASILFFLAPSLSFTQEDKQSPLGQYQWSNSVVMELCNINGESKDEKQVSIPGQKFSVLAEIDDGEYLLIRVLNYPEKLISKRGVFKTSYSETDDPNYAKFNFQDDSQKYFKVKADVVENQATIDKMIGGSLAFGVINFPFKFRPQGGGDFTGAFNLGAAIGYKLPHRYSGKFNVSLLLASSLSLVNVDSSTISKNFSELESFNNQFSAVSLSGGIMLEYGKVQAGAFIGFDFARRASQQQFDWIYQGKPWVSLAFGISIFSSEETRESSSKSNPGTTGKVP